MLLRVDSITIMFHCRGLRFLRENRVFEGGETKGLADRVYREFWMLMPLKFI